MAENDTEGGAESVAINNQTEEPQVKQEAEAVDHGANDTADAAEGNTDGYMEAEGEGGEEGGDGGHEDALASGLPTQRGNKGQNRGNNRNKMNNKKKRPFATSTRLFVGNLKSEVVTKKDFRDIWEKYGVVTEVAIHRSFGFVQFARNEDMEAAIKGEQGRMIGGKPIDLQVAKNDSRREPVEKPRPSPQPRDRRQPRKPEGPGRDRGGREERNRGRMNENRRSRSRSPRRDRRGDSARGPGPRGRRDSREDRGYKPGPAPRDVETPINGAVVSLILLGEQQRTFAESACEAIRQVGIPYEIVMLDGRTLGQALRDAEENHSRYALIVGRDNAKKQQITAKMLHLRDGGRCPTYDLRIPELVDKIVRAERDLGFLEAGMPPQAEPSQLQSSLLGLPHLFDSSATSFGTSNFLAGAQNQVSSLASLLQKVQSQPIIPAPTMPINPSLSSVAQQLQQLQQQLQQISPEQRHQLFAYQNPGVPLVGDNSEGVHVAHTYPPQYAPHPGYSVMPDSHQKVLVGSSHMPSSEMISDPQKNQISELSRLLNSLQQKNKGQ